MLCVAVCQRVENSLWINRIREIELDGACEYDLRQGARFDLVDGPCHAVAVGGRVGDESDASGDVAFGRTSRQRVAAVSDGLGYEECGVVRGVEGQRAGDGTDSSGAQCFGGLGGIGESLRGATRPNGAVWPGKDEHLRWGHGVTLPGALKAECDDPECAGTQTGSPARPISTHFGASSCVLCTLSES